MRPDVRELIRQHYAGSVYRNALSSGKIPTAGHRALIYEVINELRRKVHRELTHASDGNYDLSEQVFIKERVSLRLSFLGSFAHLDMKNAAKMPRAELALIKAKIQGVLNRYEILLLSEEEIREVIPDLERARDSLVKGRVSVWHCLFCEY